MSRHGFSLLGAVVVVSKIIINHMHHYGSLAYIAIVSLFFPWIDSAVRGARDFVVMSLAMSSRFSCPGVSC